MVPTVGGVEVSYFGRRFICCADGRELVETVAGTEDVDV